MVLEIRERHTEPRRYRLIIKTALQQREKSAFRLRQDDLEDLI